MAFLNRFEVVKTSKLVVRRDKGGLGFSIRPIAGMTLAYSMIRAGVWNVNRYLHEHCYAR